MRIDDFLNRLQRVRQLPDGQYQASCPTSMHKHGDRSAGLKIKETGDGKIILHCFSGCTSEAITEAMGLKLSDLFPEPLNRPESAAGGYKRHLSRNAWQAVGADAVICAFALDSCIQGRPFTASDIRDIRAASSRLYRFAEQQAGGV